MSRLRIGLAGLGVHGARYARHLLQGDVAGARLTAVSRRDGASGRQYADEHGLRFADDPCALATCPDVDAVVAVLPPHLHPPVAAACVAEGRPVLVEKPLAPSAAEARDLARSVDRRGTLLMVAQTLRFDGVVQALRRELPALGPLAMVSINQRFEPSDRAWIDTPGKGGIILNTGIHGFDLLRYLTGLEPVSISADCSCRLTRDTADQFVATVRLEPGGVLAVLDNARTTRSRSGRIELVGEAGQLWGDHIHRTLRRAHGRELTDLGPIAPSPTIPATLDAFVDCVQRETAPPVTARDGLAAVEMVEAAHLAAREGRRVTFDAALPPSGPPAGRN